MSTIIKHLHSGLAGAHSLSGTAGTLKTILDDVLVNGWGTATVTGVVISGGIATVTAAGHPFEPQTVALISGATVSGVGSINGEQVVLSTTSSTYTFATAAVGTVTGTVQHKFAPLGFATLSGTNVGAYQITGSGGTGFWLRVDDTGTTDARVVGYESMSDVNTGTNAFPTAAQYSGGGHWLKTGGDTNARPWAIIGDDRGFYLMTTSWYTGTSTTIILVQYFGDFNSLKSGDSYNCLLSHFNLGNNSYATQRPYCLSASYYAVTGTCWAARPYTGTGAPASQMRNVQFLWMNQTSMQSGAFGPNYPNGADGALMLAPVNLIEIAALTTMRGSLPGLLHVTQSCPGVFAYRDLVTGIGGYSGRTFRVWTAGDSGNGYLPIMIDNTGPWR